MDALVLDDDPNACECITSALTDCGVSCESFPDPVEALHRAEKRRFDIAFVDINLPKMDGMAFSRGLKDKLPGIDIVFVTGHGDYNKAIEAIKIGACDFIRKPFRRLDIALCLSRLTEKRKLTNDQKMMNRLQFANDTALELMKELDEPMTAINRFSKLVEQQHAPGTKTREYTQQIYEEALRFDAILKDVLTQLRIDAATDGR